MNRTIWTMVSFLGLWGSSTLSVAQDRKPTNDAEKQLLMKLDRQFDLDTQKRGAEGWASYFADNGTMILGDNPPIVGPKAIRKVMQQAFSQPGHSLRWKPLTCEIWVPGALGYTSGRFESRIQDKNGKTKIQRGTYISIWKKQKDGQWKILVDTGEQDKNAS